MDRQTALLVLQLPDAPTPDEVHDAFEAHVFAIRDFLFRQTVVPQVFRAKVDRLLTASEVGETLGVELPCLDGTVPEMAPLEGTADDVVRTHADNVGRLRTSMADTGPDLPEPTGRMPRPHPTELPRMDGCLVRRPHSRRSAGQAHARRMVSSLLGHRPRGGTEGRGSQREDTAGTLAAELLRLRTLAQSTVTA